jgi:hypothetical protein
MGTPRCFTNSANAIYPLSPSSHGGQVMYRLSEQVPDQTDGVTAVLRYDI